MTLFFSGATVAYILQISNYQFSGKIRFPFLTGLQKSPDLNSIINRGLSSADKCKLIDAVRSRVLFVKQRLLQQGILDQMPD